MIAFPDTPKSYAFAYTCSFPSHPIEKSFTLLEIRRCTSSLPILLALSITLLHLHNSPIEISRLAHELMAVSTEVLF